MKTMCAALVTALLITMITSGCSSGDVKSTQAPKGVVESIAAAGGTCGELEKFGEQQCHLNGTGFKFAPGEAWSQTIGLRAAACSDADTVRLLGLTDLRLLTDGHWMLIASSGDRAVIQDALAQQGITSEEHPYCS